MDPDTLRLVVDRDATTLKEVFPESMAGEFYTLLSNTDKNNILLRIIVPKLVGWT